MCFEFMALANMLKRQLDNNSSIRHMNKYTCSNQWILGYLFHNKGHDVFQKDIEEAFSLRSSTVSKTIKLMEEKKLIQRESVDYDARLKKLVLTPKALELTENVAKELKALNERFMKNLSDEQIKQLSETLGLIRKNFD